MKYFAGVDTHRDEHYLVVIDQMGQIVESLSISANSVGYAQAIEKTASYSDLIWGMEGTGSYGRPFANALARGGHTVYEVPGAVSKRHRKRLRRPGKSDPQDAHAIAEAVLREQETLPRYLMEDEHEAARLLYDRRDRAVREQTVKINRIRALALRLEIELPKDLTTRPGIDGLLAAVDRHGVVGYAEHELVDEIRGLSEDLRRIHALVSDLEKRMRPFAERLAPGLLRLRGCSVVTAVGLIGHAGRVDGYRSSNAFAAHAGTSPVECSSGKYRALRLNTRGNRQLNRCLHTIANVQIRTQDHFGKIYYDRKRAEGKTLREALRCLKRQLAKVVFRTLLHNAQTQSQLAPQPLAA